jgi:hypothetical protein
MFNANNATAAVPGPVTIASGAVALDLTKLPLDELVNLHAGLVAEIRRRHAEHSKSGVQTPKSTPPTR